MLCPCRLLIPTSYNDGRSVEPAKVVKILQSLDRQFGGYSVIGVEGSWFGQKEESIRVEVAIPEERVKELEAVVYSIGKELGQKAMYFEVGPPSVNILTIDDGEGAQ